MCSKVMTCAKQLYYVFFLMYYLNVPTLLVTQSKSIDCQLNLPFFLLAKLYAYIFYSRFWLVIRLNLVNTLVLFARTIRF